MTGSHRLGLAAPLALKADPLQQAKRLEADPGPAIMIICLADSDLSLSGQWKELTASASASLVGQSVPASFFSVTESVISTKLRRVCPAMGAVARGPV